MNKLNKMFLFFLVFFGNNIIGMELAKSYPVHHAPSTMLRSYCLPQVRPTVKRGFADEILSRQLLDSVMQNGLMSQYDLMVIAETLRLAPHLARQFCGQKALHEAIKKSRYQCIELLFKYDVSPNALMDGGNCPLHRVRDSKIAQLLIDHGAYLEQKNDKGQTPVFSVIYDSLFDVARVLLNAGANINEGDASSDTPLHYAVKHLGREEVKFLLYHGANADQPNNQGITAYQMAWERGGDIFHAFEDCKKVIFLPESFVFNNTHFNGQPSVLVGLLAHNGRCLKQLLALDASGYCSRDIVIAENVFKQCDDKVWNELRSKISPYSPELLLLVKLVRERSCYREDFLRALRNNQFFIAKQFLWTNSYLLHTYQDEYPFDEARDLLVEKFFSVSTSASDYRHIKELLCENFDFNLCDNQGRTLLCLLIMDPTDKTKYRDLLKSGVSINTFDDCGQSPLAYAILLGDEDKVETLLRYGAVVHKDMVLTEIRTLSLKQLLDKALYEQNCCVCYNHPENMSNIPCVNRHIGSFICKNCYDDNMTLQCPLCVRALDEYGA